MEHYSYATILPFLPYHQLRNEGKIIKKETIFYKTHLMSEESNLDNTVITSDSQFIALMNRQGCLDGRAKGLLMFVKKHSDYFSVSCYFYILSVRMEG